LNECRLNGLLTRGHAPHPPEAPPPTTATPTPAPHTHATPPSATQLAGLPVDAVDRIYRALYVHTVSFQRVMADEVSRMIMGDADADASPQPGSDLVATARALQSASSLPDAEAAAMAAAGATHATAQGYFYEDMQVRGGRVPHNLLSSRFAFVADRPAAASERIDRSGGCLPVPPPHAVSESCFSLTCVRRAQGLKDSVMSCVWHRCCWRPRGSSTGAASICNVWWRRSARAPTTSSGRLRASVRRRRRRRWRRRAFARRHGSCR